MFFFFLTDFPERNATIAQNQLVIEEYHKFKQEGELISKKYETSIAQLQSQLEQKVEEFNQYKNASETQNTLKLEGTIFLFSKIGI